MKNNNPYTDTTTRKYQNSNYEKTKEGWVKKVEQTEAAAAAQASPADTKKEYTDEELAEYAKKASDEALRKAGAGRDERMRVAAKKEILRRKNEGMPEPEKTDNPFDEGMEKGWFDEFPTKVFGGKEYINKGQGWEVLEKARAAVGEIRTWSGEKYQKTATGWKYIGKADGGAKPSSKKSPSELETISEVEDYAKSISGVTFKSVKSGWNDKGAKAFELTYPHGGKLLIDFLNNGEYVYKLTDSNDKSIISTNSTDETSHTDWSIRLNPDKLVSRRVEVLKTKLTKLKGEETKARNKMIRDYSSFSDKYAYQKASEAVSDMKTKIQKLQSLIGTF